MKLIVDSNRILSALIKNGLKRKILSSEELLFLLIFQNIKIISDEKVKSKMKEAMEIMKNIDIDDSPILACALAIPNDGIWTEDKHFDKQNKVKVWKTKYLIDKV